MKTEENELPHMEKPGQQQMCVVFLFAEYFFPTKVAIFVQAIFAYFVGALKCGMQKEAETVRLRKKPQLDNFLPSILK